MKQRAFISACIVLALLLCSIPLMGQDREHYEAYRDAAAGQSALFRGRQATSYARLSFNGTYFWDSPSFLQGDVRYNGRTYCDVSLNIDACEMQLLARQSPELPAVVVSRDWVESFSMGGESYLNLRAAGVDGAEEGFYRQLSETVFLQVVKVLVRRPGNANGTLIGYDDPFYDPALSTYFRCDARYYCLIDGALVKISRRKALKLVQHGS